MNKTYSYKIYPYIAEAMKTHNTIMPGPRFTLTDLSILCLARSFHDSGQKFFMTNEQLAQYMLSTDKTIRTSVDRLCDAGLLKKKYMTGAKSKGRYLIYNTKKVDAFVEEMRKENES